MFFYQISIGGEKDYLLSDILVDSSLRSPVGKDYCSSRAVYMFLSGTKPWTVVLSMLPSQACDRRLWLHCNVWAVSGESFPPAQLGTSHGC